MNEQTDTATASSTTEGDPQPMEQGRPQPQQQKFRVKVDDSGLSTIYVNAFRPNSNADEVMLDLGINTITPLQRPADNPDAPAGEIMFKTSHRVIMNYSTAKRMAAVLGELVDQRQKRPAAKV